MNISEQPRCSFSITRTVDDVRYISELPRWLWRTIPCRATSSTTAGWRTNAEPSSSGSRLPGSGTLHKPSRSGVWFHSTLEPKTVSSDTVSVEYHRNKKRHQHQTFSLKRKAPKAQCFFLNLLLVKILKNYTPSAMQLLENVPFTLCVLIQLEAYVMRKFRVTPWISVLLTVLTVHTIPVRGWTKCIGHASERDGTVPNRLTFGAVRTILSFYVSNNYGTGIN